MRIRDIVAWIVLESAWEGGRSTYQRKFGGEFRRLKNMNWRIGVQSME
jgi:hypothetical protein